MTAPPSVTAESVGTGQKNGKVRRARMSDEGSVSVIDSVSPSACRPLMWSASPARNASTPSMSVPKKDAGGWSPSLGDSARSMENRYVSAFTGWFDGGENLNPGRTVNVYVRPSADTLGMDAAASGSRVRGAPSPVRDQRRSGAQVASSTSNANVFQSSAGSGVSSW